MSTMEYKVALRAMLPDIKSGSEHLAWFRENVGEPGMVDDGDDPWFTYKYGKGYKTVVHKEPYFSPVYDDGKYGVETIISHTKDDPDGTYIDLEDLMELRDELKDMPGVSGNILFVSHGWYNGGDEPVVWE